MGFKLKSNTVYATQPTDLGIVIFHVVKGKIQLYGSNVTYYKNAQNPKIIIPKFEELTEIEDDLLVGKCVHSMSCLTNWIGFKSLDDDYEVWVNQGINIKLTPTENVIIN